MDHIVYDWLPKAVEFDESIELPQFSLVNWTLENCSQNYTTGILALNTILASWFCFFFPSVSLSRNRGSWLN